VIGAVDDKEPKGRMEVAHEFFDAIHTGKLRAAISALVLEEIERSPERVRKKLTDVLRGLPLEVHDLSSEDEELSKHYLETGAIPQASNNDARHIACAAVNGVDVIVSWNFKHMANIRVVRAVNSVNIRLGYRTIEILPPEEVIGYEGR